MKLEVDCLLGESNSKVRRSCWWAGGLAGWRGRRGLRRGEKYARWDKFRVQGTDDAGDGSITHAGTSETELGGFFGKSLINPSHMCGEAVIADVCSHRAFGGERVRNTAD